MKFLKLGFILLALTLFIFACQQANKTSPANTIIVTNINSSANTNMSTNTSSANTAIVNMNAKTDEIASTKKIYTEKCVRCHKEDGTGGITDIEGTKIKAPNFTTDKMKNQADDEFIETIEKGAEEDGMPAFKGKFTDAEIKNLVKFIRSEFQAK